MENNPPTYHDPSGHCATRSNGAPNPNDADCWRLAWTIANLWDETDYWQNRFGSVDVWGDHISPSAVDVTFMQDELDRNFQSLDYRNWRDMHPLSGPTNYEYDAANRRVAQVADAGGLAVRSKDTFDAAGNLVDETTDAGAGRLNPTARYTYTLVSGSYRTSEVMNAAGNVKHFTYDARGELVSETDALQ